jgi:signal peptidase II
VFNLADSSVVCGGILVALLALRGIGLDGAKVGKGASGASGASAGSGASGASVRSE